ncbi:uncharacterized protein LOC104583725 [Brachypodium distachyon]|nr:uncharacterized protein LOC104583725 [Brachypodium distachyon]|eukprot:XP_010235216.1 uncharacterized protein LOC104583725 [Brachypodium distachyon]
MPPIIPLILSLLESLRYRRCKSRMCGVKGSKGGVASSPATAVIVSVSLLLVAASVLALFLSPLAPPAADGKAGAPPEPVELAMAGAGHEGGHGWLDLGALRAWAKLAFLRLRPLEPRGELRSPGESVVTKAAKKSLEMGKETVEHTAESAADALRRTVSSSHGDL